MKGNNVLNPDNAIVIGADHAGYKLKEHIKKELEKLSLPYKDVGVFSEERSDYPVYIARAASKVSDGTFKRGIVFCGSGIGASMVANRFKKVRAALCVTPQMAMMSRSHNNANILVLGERITPFETATEILKIWLETPFEGGRHQNRIEQIDTVDGSQ
jgi:ribose 5-phosphate isomerase B